LSWHQSAAVWRQDPGAWLCPDWRSRRSHRTRCLAADTASWL